MADGKKITDILAKDKPSAEIAENSSSEQAKTEPTISKHGASGTFGAKDDNNPTETVSTNAETQEDATPKIVSKAGVDIKPISASADAKDDPNDQEEETGDKPPNEVSDFVSEPKDDDPDEAEGSPGIGKSPYEATDSLPIDTDKKSADSPDDTQKPKIYDTKEYFVPIKNTSHSHGAFGKVLAGILSAAVVGAIIYFVVTKLY